MSYLLKVRDLVCNADTLVMHVLLLSIASHVHTHTSLSLSPARPQVGVATILLDCGWEAGMDESFFASLDETWRRIDLVLISFGDLTHMGALPIIFKRLPKRPKIYCTLPVQKMGQMTLYDLFLSKAQLGQSPGFTLDDVDTVCQSIEVLKYTQGADIRVKTKPYLSITPYPSGRSLGGSIWRIQWRRVGGVVVAEAVKRPVTWRLGGRQGGEPLVSSTVSPDASLPFAVCSS